MLKICMVGAFQYLTDARVKGYSESLAKAGASVDVVVLRPFPQPVAIENFGVRVFTVAVPKNRDSSLSYMLEYFFSLTLLSFRLTWMCIKNRYDVLHFHNMPDFLVFAGLLSKLLGKKIILDIHDPMPEVYMSKFSEPKNTLGLTLIKLEEKISAWFADQVITANVHFRANLIKRGVPASKILVINNFPDLDIFDRNLYLLEKEQPRETFTLIFPGTIAPRYGLEVAIRAMPLILRDIPNAKLLVIGPQNDHAQKLLGIVDQLGISSSVEFRPTMPNNEIPRQLALADAGIYTALPDAHMSIAIPGKMLEFAAIGLPVITSRLQIVEELFDPTAVLFFEPGNISQFAECVLRLYRDPDLCKELVRNADENLARKPSWDQEFQAYNDVLHRLHPERA